MSGAHEQQAGSAPQGERGACPSILDRLGGIARAGAWLSAGFMLAIVGLILTEIVLRTGWNSSTQVASEYTGYFMVGLVLFGFAETFRSNAFIRIELLLSRLPSRAVRFCELVAALLSLCITLYALRYAVNMTWQSYVLKMQADTPAETPFWIPQLVIPLGLTMLALEIVLYILRRVRPS